MKTSRIQSKLFRCHQSALVITAALCIAAGLAWAGGDVWKTKPYTQWTENDVREILTQSPWVRSQDVMVSWKPDMYGSNAPMPGGTAQPGSAGSMGQSRPGMGQAGQTGAPGQQQYPQSPGAMAGQQAETTFFMRWVSSRVMREALLQNAVLRGSMQQSQVTAELAKPVTEYVIAVTGRDMTPFTKVSEKDLVATSYLEAKSSKQKIAPSSVHIQKGSDGHIEGVVFAFPRKTADGHDVVTSGEKNVQFECKVKNLNLKTSFDPRKMTDQQGLDL